MISSLLIIRTFWLRSVVVQGCVLTLPLLSRFGMAMSFHLIRRLHKYLNFGAILWATQGCRPTLAESKAFSGSM
jgi:hypothetical protein